MATKEQLLEEAQSRNLDVNSRSNKDEIEAALEADGFDLSTLDGDTTTDTTGEGSGDSDADAKTAEAEGVQEAFDQEHEQGFKIVSNEDGSKYEDPAKPNPAKDADRT